MNFDELVIAMAHKEAQDSYAQQLRQISECTHLLERFFHPQGNRPMTWDTEIEPKKNTNEKQEKIENEFNDEGKLVNYGRGQVELDGWFSVDELKKILSAME